MLDRPYWPGLWVVQEALLAGRLLMFLDHDGIVLNKIKNQQSNSHDVG
jgi:hypothetical protein